MRRLTANALIHTMKNCSNTLRVETSSASHRRYADNVQAQTIGQTVSKHQLHACTLSYRLLQTFTNSFRVATELVKRPSTHQFRLPGKHTLLPVTATAFKIKHSQSNKINIHSGYNKVLFNLFIPFFKSHEITF